MVSFPLAIHSVLPPSYPSALWSSATPAAVATGSCVSEWPGLELPALVAAAAVARRARAVSAAPGSEGEGVGSPAVPWEVAAELGSVAHSAYYGMGWSLAIAASVWRWEEEGVEEGGVVSGGRLPRPEA